MNSLTRPITRVALASLLLVSSAQSMAQDALLARNLAATCANCHGTSGNARGDMRPLAGVSADKLLAMLADYRSGAVIATLWQGLAAFFTRNGYDYLFGCASIGLEDGGAQAHAILRQVQAKYMAPSYQRVRPYHSLPASDIAPPDKVRMPPLLKAYVSLGAKACGDAYWDQDFNCADVFMLLNVSDICPRYARHFLGIQPATSATVVRVQA